MLGAAALGAAAQTTASADSLVADTARAHLSGRVLGDDGEGLPLATVRIEGRAEGTMTDLRGNYSLSFGTADSVTVVYSMMGYDAKRKVLVRPKGRLVWNVTLRSLGKSLGEITP